MAQPFKHPATGIFYLRRKVPVELRSSLGREFKRSLKTRNPREAKGLFASAWAESDKAFALARAQLAGADSMSIEDAQQLAARWFRGEQERMERQGSFVEMLVKGSEWAWERAEEGGQGSPMVALRESMADGCDWDEAAMVAPWIRQTLRKHNLPMPSPGTLSASRLSTAFIEHLHRLSDWALTRHGGEISAPAPGLPAFTSLSTEQWGGVARKEIGLRELFEAYSQDKLLNDGDTRSTRKTLANYGAITERFIELQGDVDIRAISREVVGHYRAALARMPASGAGIRHLAAPQMIAKAQAESLPCLSEPTIRNNLRALSAVLSHGVRLRWIEENPVIAGGIGRMAARAATRRAASVRRRKDFTRDELRAIFGSAVFVSDTWAPPRADFGEAWRWVPLMLYYTGARREEIAQLKVSDILVVEGGIYCLSILDTDGGEDGVRGVKTQGSRRTIPLHPDLVARGLIGYLASLPAGGALFPRLIPNPAGYYGANFGKRWSEYIRGTVGLNSTASPMHGFRHTFKTLCRDVGIPEDVHDAITGHSGDGSVARDYGSMTLQRMATEIARFPTVRQLLDEVG